MKRVKCKPPAPIAANLSLILGRYLRRREAYLAFCKVIDAREADEEDEAEPAFHACIDLFHAYMDALEAATRDAHGLDPDVAVDRPIAVAVDGRWVVVYPDHNDPSWTFVCVVEPGGVIAV